MVTRRLPLLVVRVALLLLAWTAGATLAWWLAAPPLSDLAVRLQPAAGAAADLSFEGVLAALCAGALLACVAWCSVGAAVAVAAHVVRAVRPAGLVTTGLARAADRCCPAVVRTLVSLALGTVVGAGVAAPAFADVVGVDPSADAPTSDLAGLTLPDRATGAGPTGMGSHVDPAVGAPTLRHRRVVVHAGDSLWSIAAARLPVDADRAHTTTAWHRLYRANRSRVGHDPDLIQPGTSLVVPDLDAPDGKDPS